MQLPVENADWEEIALQGVRNWMAFEHLSAEAAFDRIISRSKPSRRKKKLDAEELFCALEQTPKLIDMMAPSPDAPLSLIKCEKLLRLLDADGDSLISKQDFVDTFTASGSDSFQMLRDLLYERRLTITELIARLDENGDGRVDISEWTNGCAILTAASRTIRRCSWHRVCRSMGTLISQPLRRRLVSFEFASGDWEKRAMDSVRKAIGSAISSSDDDAARAVRRVFKRLNKNVLNKLSRGEFRRGLRELGCRLEMKDLETVFELLDTNGDGTIDIDEFLDKLAPGVAAELENPRVWNWIKFALQTVNIYRKRHGLTLVAIFDKYASASQKGMMKEVIFCACLKTLVLSRATLDQTCPRLDVDLATG